MAAITGARPRRSRRRRRAADDSSPAPLRTLREARYEVFPLAGIDREVAKWLPAGAKIAVTASPRRGLAETLDLAERLTVLGYSVVPHLSARLVTDEVHLKEILDRLDELAIREVFVIAGDANRAVGAFPDAQQLLHAMADLEHGLLEVGIAGYPESHPKISDDVLIQAMWDKRHYATYIVSQLCFDPVVITRWIDRVRARGVTLPIYIGVPGPASVAKLLRVSRRIGVGDSTRFLAHHGLGVLRIGWPGHYSPDRLIARLSSYAEQPGADVRGLHVYTFNDLDGIERWRGAKASSPPNGEVA